MSGRFDLTPLFEPRGIVVVGASSHPGKFGFVALHNILAAGYAGEVYATNLEGGELLGLPVTTSVDDLPVDGDGIVGATGWYTGRPGFAIGGAGVAAVWWGGAAGLLERVVGHLPADPDAHQLAHLGELHALLQAADALLGRVASVVDAASPPGGPTGAVDPVLVAEVRSVVERTAREVLDRGPRMVGPTALSRDADLARALADLTIYVRQHHGERDHAALGRQVLATRRSR